MSSPKAARRARPSRGTSPRPSGCPRTRRRAAPAPRAASGTPRRSPRRSSRHASPRAGTRSLPPPRGQTAARPSCFTTSTTGQYVIPSPYDRHRPRTTLALEASKSLSGQAASSDPSLSDDRHQLAPLLCACLHPGRGDLVQFPLTADEHNAVQPLGNITDTDEPERRHRLRLPLSSRARPAPPRQRPAPTASSRGRAAPRRAALPAPAAQRH